MYLAFSEIWESGLKLPDTQQVILPVKPLILAPETLNKNSSENKYDQCLILLFM